MHTKDFLAAELRKAGLNAMADRAATGWYHDFLSPLAMPETQLMVDLKTYAEAPSWPRQQEARALLERHLAGEFDASKEESAEWAGSAEGRETMGKLIAPGAREKKAPREAVQAGRLAIRQEGTFLNAYYAEANTMLGAMLLGSLHMAMAENAERRQAFIALMREGFGDIAEKTLGSRPLWPTAPRPAPESERGGNA